MLSQQFHSLSRCIKICSQNTHNAQTKTTTFCLHRMQHGLMGLQGEDTGLIVLAPADYEVLFEACLMITTHWTAEIVQSQTRRTKHYPAMINLLNNCILCLQYSVNPVTVKCCIYMENYEIIPDTKEMGKHDAYIISAYFLWGLRKKKKKLIDPQSSY